MLNTRFPSSIQSLADEIMEGRRGFAPGVTMSLGTDVAPDPEPQTPPVGQGETFFTQADIQAAVEKARQQEKDKLYGKVSSLETQVEEVNRREQERLAQEAQARQEAEEKARRAEEENLSAKELLARKEQEWQQQLSSTQQTLEQRLADLQAEREAERALLEKEKQFSALQSYRAQRLAEESETVAPQFHEFIQGNTQQDIDQAIELAKARSAEIAAQVQAAMQASRQQQRGVGVSGYAPVGPMEVEGGQRQYSPADIANMDMAEYAKNRPALIGGGSASNRGLFG